MAGAKDDTDDEVTLPPLFGHRVELPGGGHLDCLPTKDKTDDKDPNQDEIHAGE